MKRFHSPGKRSYTNRCILRMFTSWQLKLARDEVSDGAYTFILFMRSIFIRWKNTKCTIKDPETADNRCLPISTGQLVNQNKKSGMTFRSVYLFDTSCSCACLNTMSWRRMRSILNLGTRWRWVVSFRLQPLYRGISRPRYPSDGRLGGSRGPARLLRRT
jgi:hypothetical protein